MGEEADKITGRSWEGFMDANDFYHEEGRPIEGNRIFANKDGLEGSHGCGIVRVRVEFVRWEELSAEHKLKEEEWLRYCETELRENRLEEDK